MGLGTMRLIGKKGNIETFPIKQIKQVRLVKRADGDSRAVRGQDGAVLAP
jgi:hypothetical protein